VSSVLLERLETGDHGTFGRIVLPGLSLFTGELPYRDNLPNLSCLPDGVYNVVWTFSPAFRREMYLMLGTHPRAGIRKHSANFMGDRTKGLRSQLYGCIALGERLGWMGGQKALLLSAPAVRRFEDHMERKPFKLEITGGA
jgi:hypothetical protein